MILSIRLPKKGVSMFRKKIPAMIVLVCLVFASACNLPGQGPAAAGTPPVENLPIETQVALMVASTLTSQANLAGGMTATQEALATNTPEFTPTPTLSPTQTSTLTPSVPMVTVSVNTNCRSGPSTVYDILGVMMVGHQAQVVGRSTLSDTMIIQLPSNLNVTCWLWAGNATVSGDTSGLPVFPIPATPTPKFSPTPQVSFSVAYASTDFCLGLYRVKFKITNTGILTWESDQVSVTDQATSVTKTITYDNFPYYSASCDTGADLNLEKGEVGYTTSDGFVVNPAGHAMAALIQVCSQDGMVGTCLQKSITFTP
jgi:hypothetical protein